MSQNLKFIHLNTGSASAHKADTGAIIFEKATGRIAVATGANTDVEYYGGGRIADAKFENSILTISFNDTAETIKLDFSDVASTSGVNKILGTLRTDVNALKTIVGAAGDAADATGSVYARIAKNKADIATNATAIQAINAADTGILAQAKSYTDGKVDGKFDTVGSAARALKDAKDYADGLAKDYDAAGAAAQALKDAKAYTDTATNALGGRVTTLETTVGDASNGLVKKVDDNAKDITALKGRADALETKVGNESSGLIKDVAANTKAIAAINHETTGILAQAKSYTDTEIGKVNTAAGALGNRVTALENKVGDDSKGLVKQVNDNETKLNTLIGTDAGKSARTISAEEVAKVVAKAPEDFDTLKEIADWITNDTTGAAKMANDISALKTTVGKEAEGDSPATGLVKGVKDNKSSIDAHNGRITKLEALHAKDDETMKSVATEVSEGIAGIAAKSASNAAKSDVVVTVTTEAGSVKTVTVDAGVLKKAVTDETTRATDVEQKLRADLGTKLETEGDAFTRIKALEEKQSSGTLMWSVWD